MCVCVFRGLVVSDSLRPRGLQRLCQAPLSMGFSHGEYWRIPCPPPGDLPNPGIKPSSPKLQVNSLPSMMPGKPN